MLTDAQIRALPVPERERLIPAGGRLGLYLRVRPTGKRTWMTRRRVGGEWRIETLGDWPVITALNARRKASTATTRTAAVIKFGEAAERFYREEIEARYRSERPEAYRAYLVNDCATLLPRRLDRLTRQDFVPLVRDKARTAPAAAARMLFTIKQLFAWATIGGLLDTDPLAGVTARALKIPALTPRERKLSDDELRSLWSVPDEPYGRLLRFALLTGGRIGEAIGIEPGQVVDSIWHIPMTKNGKPHALPLTATALALAQAGWPKRGYQAVYSYFTSRGITWRPHDLRRTAATRMSEAGVPSDAIEAVLNHSRPKLLRTYQQPDQMPAMRDALLRLEAVVAKVVAAQPAQAAA